MGFWTLQKYDSIHVDYWAIHHSTSINTDSCAGTHTHVTDHGIKISVNFWLTKCYAKQALINHCYYFFFFFFGQLFRAYQLPFSQLQVWEISAKWNSDSVKQGKNRDIHLVSLKQLSSPMQHTFKHSYIWFDQYINKNTTANTENVHFVITLLHKYHHYYHQKAKPYLTINVTKSILKCQTISLNGVAQASIYLDYTSSQYTK